MRLVGRAEQVEVAPLRDHHRVVVAVVGPLDLDDLIATGDGPHEVNGIHGCLRAGVVEPPQRHVEAARELARHDDRVVGGLGEVRALCDPALHGLDDGRVGVAANHHSVSTVQIDVLGAVDVPDLRAFAVADPNGCRARDHPVGRGSAGEHLRRLFGANE